jgi:hypothetical protein
MTDRKHLAMKDKNINIIATLIGLAIFGLVVSISLVIPAQPILPQLINTSAKQAATSKTPTSVGYLEVPARPRPALATLKLNFTNATGSIASLQNSVNQTWGQQFVKKGIWFLTGKWNLAVPSTSKLKRNLSATTFDATFDMVRINGTGMHNHNISDFRIIGRPTINDIDHSTTFRGIGTVTLKDGPQKNVRLTITLIDKSLISIGVDRKKTEGHFGFTPIFGTVTTLR